MINKHPLAKSYPYELPEGWFYDFDIETYRRFYSKLPDNSITVEIGVWKGRSICSVYDIILRKNITVYAVDTFEGSPDEDAHKGVNKQTQLDEFKSNIRLFGLQDNVVHWVSTSDGFFKSILNKPERVPELIFIDGDHGDEQFTRDLNNSLKAVRKGGVVIGHDYQWKDNSGKETIKQALAGHYHVVHFGSIWQIKPTVRASVASRNRMMTTTPLAVMSIANQSLPPDHLIIFDDTPDNEKVDWPNSHVWKQLFHILEAKNIKWEVMMSNGIGQVRAHQATLDITRQRGDAKYIWRVDDDNIPEYNVLETLVSHMESDDYDAAAVCAIEPKDFLREAPFNAFTEAGLALECVNKQWFYDQAIHQAEHLYSSFIYNPLRVGNYSDELSTVGHTEETQFTLGKSCLIDNSVINWHIRSDSGGIRDFKQKELWESDEKKFKQFYNESFSPWKVIGCINGLGDAYALRSVLNDIASFHEGIMLVTNTLDPFIGIDNPKVRVIPIWHYAPGPQESWNVYRFMDEQKNKGVVLTLAQAWLEMYKK